MRAHLNVTEEIPEMMSMLRPMMALRRRRAVMPMQPVPPIRTSRNIISVRYPLQRWRK